MLCPTRREQGFYQRAPFVKLLMRHADSSLLVLAALLFSAPAMSKLAAQLPQPVESWCLPADSGGARVWGTVYDSVSRLPLASVMVKLQPADERGEVRYTGSGWFARTDSVGRFCFRGAYVHHGFYRLTASHTPVLGIRRPAPTYRALRVDSPGDTAISLPYRSLRALDSIATQRIRDSLLALIRDQRQWWRARRPARYYYEAMPNCLCPSPAVTIVVEGDSAVGTLDPKTGTERLDHSSRSLMTIDGIFDWLEGDVRNPANNRWTITWDARYGFPASWEAGTDVIIIDAYGGATITRFEPARR